MADDRTCSLGRDGQQSCTGDLESEEGEVSSLLQRKGAQGSAQASSGCPLPSIALSALKSGVNSIFEGYFFDFELEHTVVSKVFKIKKRCSVNCTMEAALNITGLKGIRVNDFDCNNAKCIERGLFGFCTKYRVGVTANLASDSFSINGFGDASAGFGGRYCSFLDHLPDIPRFETSLHVVSPKVGIKFSVDMNIAPPGISNPELTPVTFTYDKVEDFDCGLNSWPRANSICSDFVDRILNDVKENILKTVRSRIASSALEEDVLTAARSAYKDSQGA